MNLLASCKVAIESRIRALGTNLLIISPGSFTSGGRRAGEGTAMALSEGDIEIIRAKVPGVAAIAGTISGSGPLVGGGGGGGAGRNRDAAARTATGARGRPRRFPRARHGGLHPHPQRDAKHLEP